MRMMVHHNTCFWGHGDVRGAHMWLIVQIPRIYVWSPFFYQNFLSPKHIGIPKRYMMRMTPYSNYRCNEKPHHAPLFHISIHCTYIFASSSFFNLESQEFVSVASDFSELTLLIAHCPSRVRLDAVITKVIIQYLCRQILNANLIKLPCC